jgi:protein-tyrosine phosphatase
MSKITRNIWIGSYKDSCNSEFLEKNDITHILCCAKEFHRLPKNLDKTKYTYERIPIVEQHVGKLKFIKWFRKGSDILDKWVKEGHHILVHCAQGISRSDSVVLTYFILKRGLTFNSAYRKVKTHRHRIHPYSNFIPVLKDLSRHTRKNIKIE